MVAGAALRFDTKLHLTITADNIHYARKVGGQTYSHIP